MAPTLEIFCQLSAQTLSRYSDSTWTRIQQERCALLQGDERIYAGQCFAPLLGLAFALSTHVAQGSSAFGPARSDRQPLASAEISWDESAQRFNGRVAYEWPKESPLEFALYPNRYLQWEEESRQDREFNSLSLPGEDFSLADRTGAFVPSGARAWRLSESTSCTEPELRRALGSAPPTGRAIPVEQRLGSLETTLWVGRHSTGPELPVGPPEASGCTILVIDFAFYPPESEGHFGRKGPVHHYLGPLIPIQLSRFHSTRLLYRGLEGFCAQCSASPEGLVQEYHDLPSPVHLQSSAADPDKPVPVIRRMDVAQSSVYYSEASDPATQKRTLDLIRLVLERSQRRYVRQLPELKFVVYFDLLMRKLSLTQTNEIQLGRAFLKVNPLFQKYHEASLVRSVLALLFFGQLSEKIEIKNYRDYVFARNIAEHQAAVHLKEWFDQLDELRELSQALSFIPLFDDIIEGKAFINNDVFLGKPERPDGLDTQPEFDLHNFFTGDEVSQRVVFCFGQAGLSSLAQEVEAFSSGQIELHSFMQNLEAVRSEDCGYSLGALLAGIPVPEWIETDILDLGNEQRVAHFRRLDRASLTQSLFLDLTREGQLYDVPYIMVSKASGGTLSGEYWLRNANVPVRTYALPDGEQTVSEIRGPVFGASDDTRIFPRRYRFLISGLKFSLDTGADEIKIGSGFLFRSVGDTYRRTFSLGVTIGNSQTVTEGAFSLDLRTLFVDSRRSGLQLEEGRGVFDVNTLPVSMGVGVRAPYEETDADRVEPFVFLSISAGKTNGDKLVPQGAEMGFLVRRVADLQGDLARDGYQELRLSVSQPLGRLTTFLFSPAFGRSDNVKILSEYVPGSGSDLYSSRNFISTSTQLQSVIASNINVDLLGSVLFQDVLIYGAHHAAAVADDVSERTIFSKNLQTISIGLRMFGAFFGAKNQSMSVSMLRSLTDKLGNSFVLTVGSE